MISHQQECVYAQMNTLVSEDCSLLFQQLKNSIHEYLNVGRKRAMLRGGKSFIFEAEGLLKHMDSLQNEPLTPAGKVFMLFHAVRREHKSIEINACKNSEFLHRLDNFLRNNLIDENLQILINNNPQNGKTVRQAMNEIIDNRINILSNIYQEENQTTQNVTNDQIIIKNCDSETEVEETPQSRRGMQLMALTQFFQQLKEDNTPTTNSNTDKPNPNAVRLT